MGTRPPAPVTPRAAASTIVVRDAGAGLELLLVRRTPAARFMGGAWVFPGGAVDARDGTGEAGLRAAARRELAEEAGLVLPGDGDDGLVPFSRWITPPESPIRFDTWFYLALAPPGQAARPDGSETVAADWQTSAGALDRHRAGRIALAFPTLRQLEQLSGFADAGALLGWAARREIVPVRPRIVGTGEAARIVLPDEA